MFRPPDDRISCPSDVHTYIYIYIFATVPLARERLGMSWNVQRRVAPHLFVAFLRLYMLDHLFDMILDRFLMDFWINMSPQTDKNQVKQLVCLP